jgi:hypothetical protein
MPIPLVDFPPTVRLLLWALVLGGISLAQFGVSLSATAPDASLLTEVQAYLRCPGDMVVRERTPMHYVCHVTADQRDWRSMGNTL